MTPRPTVILLAVVGIGLLLTPATSSEVRGDRVFVSVSQADAPDGDVQTYDELPPEARTAFDEALEGAPVGLHETSNREAIEALEAVDYVHVDRTYYRVHLRYEVNDSTFGEFLDRFLRAPLVLLGGFLVGYSLLTARDRDWQPATLRQVGPLIALAWLLSAIGTVVAIYLETGLFLAEETQMFLSYTGVFTVTLVPFLTGGAIRRRNWPLAGSTFLPIAALGVLGLFGVGTFIFLLGHVILIGGPLAVVGYSLTDPLE